MSWNSNPIFGEKFKSKILENIGKIPLVVLKETVGNLVNEWLDEDNNKIRSYLFIGLVYKENITKKLERYNTFTENESVKIWINEVYQILMKVPEYGYFKNF